MEILFGAIIMPLLIGVFLAGVVYLLITSLAATYIKNARAMRAVRLLVGLALVGGLAAAIWNESLFEVLGPGFRWK